MRLICVQGWEMVLFVKKQRKQARNGKGYDQLGASKGLGLTHNRLSGIGVRNALLYTQARLRADHRQQHRTQLFVDITENTAPE